MISALAFGYGVGMAAPQAALDNLATDPQAAQQGPIAYAAGYPPYGYPMHPYGYPPGHAASPLPQGADESEQLAMLRRNSEGASCRMGGPMYSKHPKYLSEDEGSELEDPDDLDPAGQAALSKLQLPDFNIPITRRALNYVRFLTRTHRGRELFSSWMKRSGRYTEMVQQHLREFHLPEDLIWVAMIESGFDPAVRSPAGAVGLWQFMQSTGEVYGLHVTGFVDERKNPIQATRAAAHHLRDLYQRFGSWDLAFAAYNMGYEQLLERIDRYGTSDFTELSRQQALPSETMAYVPKIIAAAMVANNLERYGFDDVEVYQPIYTSELTVPGGTSLKIIAKAAGISTANLKKYNPHLLKETVPPGRDYVVFIPPDTLSRARTALPMMADSKTASTDADILAPDDLFGLSETENKEMAHNAWNEDENLLRFLPKPKRRSMRNILGGEPGPPPAEEAAKQAAISEMSAIADEFAPRRTDREVVMYRVGSGDTLIGLAKQFAVDIEDLARDNNLDSEDLLREGALLKILVKSNVLSRWKEKVGDFEKALPSRRRKKSG